MRVRGCPGVVGLAVLLVACGRFSFDAKSQDAAVDSELDAAPDVCVASVELCNGVDDNCNTSIDETFGVCDGCCDAQDYDLCSDDDVVCSTASSVSCSDSGATAIIESSFERCDNTMDDDCDGAVDEGCPCTWSIVDVDSTGNVGEYASLVIDSGDKRHIAYYDATDLDLMYAVFNGTWTIEIAASTGTMGKLTSLALSPADGNPSISYWDETNNRVMLARREGTWSSTEVLGGSRSSLSFTPLGAPVIAVQTATSLQVATGPFPFALAMIDNIVASDHVLVRNASDELHVFYTSSSTFHHAIGLEGASAGLGLVTLTDLAVAENPMAPPKWFAVYRDSVAKNLMLIEDSSVSGSSSIVFSLRALAAEGDVGHAPSLAISSTGELHVSYYDATNGDLIYLHGAGDDWSRTTIAETGDVGRHSSIALDTAGKPHIAFRDDTGQRLRLASCQ